MVDKQSPIPIYAQIEEQLKNQIAEGKFPPGAAIPSERELTETFGVSRMTVRQSITNLVNDGLLYREKGRGTFVAAPKVEQPLSGLTSFTEDMLSRGMAPSNQLLKFEKRQPDKGIAEKLHIAESAEIYFVERIRYADGIPMAIERTYLPVALFPDLSGEVLKESLYKYVEKTAKLKISGAVQRMEAALAKKEDADLLHVETPFAVLVIERVSKLSSQVPFEVVRSTYRADRYKFTSEIQR
ncbi:GntR family transcriptional regulator [Planomicrobium sp. CPCC 101110]|uniref:GntR family transcriptional regulator n=1 Tax=Planomicrobium sp. CPCC 101110 TaxID=2599619 RepID=UPI0011B42318|nr:GntR family transcriptional regulator [Planomicrobium sp. CPCC 101110]TWT25366.1 GntR family transcriptional regulator [Planomicrobium sp. CPCC 101110]